MSVIGEFTVPAEEFALAHALSAVPDMRAEVDRLASHSTMEVMPFVWITGAELQTLESAIEADPSVASFTVADDLDDELLFRIRWSSEVCELVDDMVDHHAAVQRAEAAGGRWKLRLRFVEQSMVSDFQSYFAASTGYEVHSLTETDEPRQSEFGVTPEQRAALVEAARSGYLSIPRATSAEALGERLGISANAASERVRRGCEALIRSSLMIGGDDERRDADASS